jgi:hypothetical protein
VAKYQHYVPQLHLRNFVGSAPQGMVWTYDKRTLRTKPSKAENTGGQQYFYAVRKPDGELDHTVDEHLQGVENRAAEPYRKLLRGEIPTGQDRADFCSFLATLHLRTPGMLRTNAQARINLMQTQMNANWRSREAFERNLDKMDADLGTKTDDRDGLWEFFQDKGGYYLETGHQDGLTALIAADRIQEILYERNWYIAEAGQDFFITSDQPVERSAPPESVHPIYGDGGFNNDRAQVTLPLSPTLCLMMTGDRFSSSKWVIDADAVSRMNHLRARYAERWIWSHVKSDRVAALAEQYQDSRLEMRFSNEEDLAEVIVRRSGAMDRKEKEGD